MVWPQNINWNFFLHADARPGILRQDPSNILNVHNSHLKTHLLFRRSQLWNHLPEEHPYFLLIKIFQDFLLYEFRNALGLLHFILQSYATHHITLYPGVLIIIYSSNTWSSSSVLNSLNISYIDIFDRTTLLFLHTLDDYVLLLNVLH